jgi:Tfp pilus assembly protein FimT
MPSRRGLTVLEVLVTVALFWAVTLLAAPALGSFLSRLEFRSAVRGVVGGLSAARSHAICGCEPVRAEIAGNRLLLSRDRGEGWRVFRGFDLAKGLTVRANGRPVFSPLGSAAPLCTVTLRDGRHAGRVVVSLYGRIKAYEDP